jgi:uncharacterized protein (TIGR02147 family)
MAKSLVFNSLTFHQFIIQAIENNTEIKRGHKKFIAESLNMHPTLLSQVLSGSRSFTDEQVFMLGEYFGLSDLESDYIFVLHQIDNIENKKFKARLVKRRDELRSRSLHISERVDKERVLSDEERALFYSSWQYTSIRLFTSLDGGKSKEEISQRFDIDKKKINEILDFLVRTGLCRFEKGKYYMHVSRTHIEQNSPYFKQHHNNWRIKSIQNLDNLIEEDLHFTGPLSISNDDFDILREEMVSLIQKVSSVVKDSEAEDIYCFNLDFFKI